MRRTTGFGTAGSRRTIARSRIATGGGILLGTSPAETDTSWCQARRRVPSAAKARVQQVVEPDVAARDAYRCQAPRRVCSAASGLAHEALAGGRDERHRLGEQH